jgi:OOP family OmpA-OmpF porin
MTKAETIRPGARSVKSKFLSPFLVRKDRSTAGIMSGRFLSLLVAALLSSGGSVVAGNREGAFTLSPFIGGQGFPVIFNGEEHIDADLYWGARAGYNFTSHFRGELLFAHSSTKRDPGDHPFSLFQYGADLNYLFRPDKAIVPFVSAGFGGFTSDFDDYRFHDDHTSAYFNTGGGLEWFLTDWFALRADFRYLVTFDRGEHGLLGSLGVTFQFGRR